MGCMAVYAALLPLYGDAARSGVEGDVCRGEEPFEVAAAYGLLDSLQIEVRGRDEGYVVAEVERYVQLVGREEYALVLSVRQLGQKRAQFVAVGHVEEGRVCCASARAIMIRWHSPSDMRSIVRSA